MPENRIASRKISPPFIPSRRLTFRQAGRAGMTRVMSIDQD
jgi:hypothetical protein